MNLATLAYIDVIQHSLPLANDELCHRDDTSDPAPKNAESTGHEAVRPPGEPEWAAWAASAADRRRATIVSITGKGRSWVDVHKSDLRNQRQMDMGL